MIAALETIEAPGLFEIELEKKQRDLVVLALNRFADEPCIAPYMRRQIERLANQAIQSRKITIAIPKRAAVMMGLAVSGDDRAIAIEATP